MQSMAEHYFQQGAHQTSIETTLNNSHSTILECRCR